MRRLHVLVKGLPPDAACLRVDGRQWTAAHELAAKQIEVMDAWGRNLYALMYQKFTGGKRPDMSQPITIPRPGVAQPEPARTVSILEALSRVVG